VRYNFVFDMASLKHIARARQRVRATVARTLD
jgi:hypothetical protein